MLLGGIWFVLKTSEEFSADQHPIYKVHIHYIVPTYLITYIPWPPSKSRQFQWMNSIKLKKANTKSLAIHTYINTYTLLSLLSVLAVVLVMSLSAWVTHIPVKPITLEFRLSWEKQLPSLSDCVCQNQNTVPNINYK